MIQVNTEHAGAEESPALVVTVSGPAKSGKTTVALAIVAALDGLCAVRYQNEDDLSGHAQSFVVPLLEREQILKDKTVYVEEVTTKPPERSYTYAEVTEPLREVINASGVLKVSEEQRAAQALYLHPAEGCVATAAHAAAQLAGVWADWDVRVMLEGTRVVYVLRQTSGKFSRRSVLNYAERLKENRWPHASDAV